MRTGATGQTKACDPSVGRRDGKRRGFSSGLLELAGRQSGEHLTPANHIRAQGLTGGAAHEKSQFDMETWCSCWFQAAAGLNAPCWIVLFGLGAPCPRVCSGLFQARFHSFLEGFPQHITLTPSRLRNAHTHIRCPRAVLTECVCAHKCA